MSVIVPITRFNKIVTDSRSRADGAVQTVTNFDVLTNAQKITPYRDSVSGDANATTDKIGNFCYVNSALYALANDVSSPATVLFKTDLTNSAWGTKSNNTATFTPSRNCFVPYHGLIYVLSGTNNTVWANDPTGGSSFVSVATLSGSAFTTSCQGLVHSKDDNLYIGYGNNIARNNNGSWTTAITLPSKFYITSLAEFGNYLAIACAPVSGAGKSVVYLWDRDSSLTTLSEVIDFGESQLLVIENIEGTLIGISISNTNLFNERVSFRSYTSGDKAEVFEEFVGGNVSILSPAKQIINNRLYFMMSLLINGTVRSGTWSIGRIAPGAPLGVVHEHTQNNDTQDLGGGLLLNFIFVGDYLFQAYSDTNGDYQLSKTNDQASYTASSILETTINQGMPEGDRIKQKKLEAVALMYDNFPSGGQAILEYCIDGGAYQPVFTETTANAQNTEVQDATGTPFTDGRDICFRVISKGGVEITALVYRYQTSSSLLNP